MNFTKNKKNQIKQNNIWYNQELAHSVLEEIIQYLENYQAKHGDLPNYLRPVYIAIHKYDSPELSEKAEKQYDKLRFNDKAKNERKKKALKARTDNEKKRL